MARALGGLREGFQKVVMPMSSDSEDMRESEECPREREKQMKGLEERKGENLLRRGWATTRQKGRPCCEFKPR